MVLSLTAQGSKTMASNPLVPKPKGGTSEQMAPFYAFLSPRRQQYLLEWHLCKLTWVILNKSIAARSRGAQRDLHLPMLLYALICAGPIWTQNYHVHPAPAPSVTLMPSNNVVSRHIPLGLQTPFKECLCSCVMK